MITRSYNNCMTRVRALQCEGHHQAYMQGDVTSRRPLYMYIYDKTKQDTAAVHIGPVSGS